MMETPEIRAPSLEASPIPIDSAALASSEPSVATRIVSIMSLSLPSPVSRTRRGAGDPIRGRNPGRLTRRIGRTPPKVLTFGDRIVPQGDYTTPEGDANRRLLKPKRWFEPESDTPDLNGSDKVSP